MDAMLLPTLLCPKAWEGMSGNETSRFCSYCKKNVHNLNALSVSERVALLASPAASICARYTVAIRCPAEGKEESYMRQLLKCGVGVALTSSALLVLCEMYAENEKRTYYRAFAGQRESAWEMPPDCYKEHAGITLGMVISLPEDTPEHEPNPAEPGEAQPIDLKLEPAEVDRLLDQIKPPAPEPLPIVTLKAG